MKRGDIVIGAERGDFTGKPRPFLVVQADRMLAGARTVTVCPLTTHLIGIGRIRIAIPGGADTGLAQPSEIEVDRVTTMRAARIGKAIGRASAEVMAGVDRALRRWLDL